MIRPLRSAVFYQPRIVVLLAVLCVIGLRFQEITHEHVADDGPTHCLLCKSSADNPAALEAITDSAVFYPPCWDAPLPEPATSRSCLPFTARGPPTLS